MPRAASTLVVYDFGPGALNNGPGSHNVRLAPLEVGPPQASAALNNTAVLYRLGYADAQALKPYALARWSMPPAQLLGQRLREHLSRQRAVVSPGEIIGLRPASGAASAPQTRAEPLLNLRLELEEFSQWFETPDQSSALLRLRATLTLRSAAGESLLAQRSFVVQQPAPSPDANGAVRALASAADQAVQHIEAWLAQIAAGATGP